MLILYILIQYFSFLTFNALFFFLFSKKKKGLWNKQLNVFEWIFIIVKIYHNQRVKIRG